MITKLLAALFVTGSLAVGAAPAFAAEPDVLHRDGQQEALQGAALHQEVQLSPDLLALLRAEMVEITGGMQSITFFLATADWHSIQETSEKIRDSYIMKMKLSAAQMRNWSKRYQSDSSNSTPSSTTEPGSLVPQPGPMMLSLWRSSTQACWKPVRSAMRPMQDPVSPGLPPMSRRNTLTERVVHLSEAGGTEDEEVN